LCLWLQNLHQSLINLLKLFQVLNFPIKIWLISLNSKNIQINLFPLQLITSRICSHFPALIHHAMIDTPIVMVETIGERNETGVGQGPAITSSHHVFQRPHVQAFVERFLWE
jgi:hypothetical protein